MTEQISVVEQVLGIDRPHDTSRSINQAMTTLTGRRLPRLSLNTLLGRGDITRDERGRDLAAVTELLRGEVGQANTLTDWPAYTRLLRDHGKASEDGHATALLIGSYSAISSRAFECLARTEYGADKILVIDPVGGIDKCRHGAFLYGSGTQLPFKDGSMDFMHTNRLLHMLRDPAVPERTQQESWSQLIHEIGRVATGGGQVFMKESVPGALDDVTDAELMDRAGELAGFITESLKRAGFRRGYAGLGGVVEGTLNEAASVRVLFDPERPMDVDPQMHDMSTIEIYAQKLAPSEQPLSFDSFA